MVHLLISVLIHGQDQVLALNIQTPQHYLLVVVMVLHSALKQQ